MKNTGDIGILIRDCVWRSCSHGQARCIDRGMDVTDSVQESSLKYPYLALWSGTINVMIGFAVSDVLSINPKGCFIYINSRRVLC